MSKRTLMLFKIKKSRKQNNNLGNASFIKCNNLKNLEKKNNIIINFYNFHKNTKI